MSVYGESKSGLSRRSSVSDGAELHPTESTRVQSMADPLMLADRAARFVRPGEGAVELLGRSAAIVRVQEMIRRGAAVDGGALITAEAGADIEAVARELHQRGRAEEPRPRPRAARRHVPAIDRCRLP